VAVTDGQTVAVTRFTSDETKEPPSLHLHAHKAYTCEDGVCRMAEPGTSSGHALIVASEALSDDPGWRVIERNHMILLRPDASYELRSL
jgi:predicted glutamine amidotransferase